MEDLFVFFDDDFKWVNPFYLGQMSQIVIWCEVNQNWVLIFGPNDSLKLVNRGKPYGLLTHVFIGTEIYSCFCSAYVTVKLLELINVRVSLKITCIVN